MPIYLGKHRVPAAALGNLPVSNLTQSYLNIGDYFQGGRIAYFNDASRRSGLIIGDLSVSNYIWGCFGTSITTSTALGQGQSNTTNILAACATRPIAASYADDYSNAGYTDWYLPSRDELAAALQSQITYGANFGFISGNGYQTSSQINANLNTWVSYIAGGISYTDANKGVATQVFPMRSFSV
jgi:hypothetical protein